MAFPLFAPRRSPAGAAAAPAAARAAVSPAAVTGSTRNARTYAREAAALVLLASALYWMLALGSFLGDPMRPEVVGEDWVGPVGAALARSVIEAVGVVAWLLPVELAVLAMPLLADRPPNFGLARVSGNVVVAVVLAALTHVAMPSATSFGGMPIGGAVGELFGELMRGLFSTIGSYIVGLTVVGLILIGRAAFSFIEWAQRTGRLATSLGQRGAGGLRALGAAWDAARALDRRRKEEERAEVEEEPVILRTGEADAIIAALADPDDAPAPRRRRPAQAADTEAAGMAEEAAAEEAFLRDASTPASDATPVEVEALRSQGRGKGVRVKLEKADAPVEEVATPSPILPVIEDEPAGEPEAIDEPALDDVGAAPARRARARAKEPRIVDTSAAREIEKAEVVHVVPAIGHGFRLPSPEMLDAAGEGRIVVDEEQLKETAQRLEKTLADYGVSGRVEEIHPGPTVTTFEVSPAAGTKVSKVAGLADDLALGLSRKVRIIAPIPGKNRIGFEIPNEHRMPVNLRELIEDRRFLEMKAPLPCVLGRDIVGAPYFADLSSMPHVIVAGATGAGKSVGLNVMLVSLLHRKTPEDLRLLMIDPKVVELAPFDRIPHMLLPVVTDMKQAANALKWAVDEMERRYQLFANAGTKNITTYNGWVERVRRGEARPPKPPARVSAVAPDGSSIEVDAAKDGTDAALPEKIPFIVIVVDEFADLMMQQGKDVEAAVARLAQKARAAGMHVILATQRPSVDVITGMIKANFPTRIAFRVAQKVDSRTILDEQGAEHLLGKGDMLVKMNGSNETRRVQCPFCSEEEVQRVTDFLRLQGEPVYDEAILAPRDEEGGEPLDQADAEADPLYDAAVRIIAETRRCSTSWLQRKLGIGYNRAAKIVETMERRGLVGPANGAKDREVLVAPL
jgi:S-DNA-T family DNA segregation ATPase FtsK/SpoIIIE